MDILADDSNIDDDIDTKLNLQVLQRYIDTTLTDRERETIISRYGLLGVDPLPQRELAKRLNISRSYISRIEKKALGKLRNRFEQGD